MDKSKIETLGDDIKSILLNYVLAESITNTEGEKDAERFFQQYFASVPYFRAHMECFGTYPIAADPLQRSVSWAMVRGCGHDTVVLIHHSDVASIEDFRDIKGYAFSPCELEDKLKEIMETLPQETHDDLESGRYQYGRGVCDMKGGGAIQIALMKYYSQLEKFNGNLVLMALPDEENLSAGMRAGVQLLKEMQDTYNFKYVLMINSEPHQRKVQDRGLFSIGSIGKLMPFIYVRGFLAHAGKVFEGLNPLNIMAGIIRDTELNGVFCDMVGNEASPPPTWLYLKDSKEHYDVSMPLSIYGCLSVQTMAQTPHDVLDKLGDIAAKAFDKVIEDANKSYANFCTATHMEYTCLPWRTKLVSMGALYAEACKCNGTAFKRYYKARLEELTVEVRQGKSSLLSANRELIEWLFDHLDNASPCVVYGLVPPYYPHVSNNSLKHLSHKIAELPKMLCEFSAREFNQQYDVEEFYTGISDLSYCNVSDRVDIERTLKDTMPLWGSAYDLPVDVIAQISMPCINIGPWGKDFHKNTERVLKEDLYIRTPQIIDAAIRFVLGN